MPSRLEQLGGQQRDAPAVRACAARRVEGGRRFVQTFLEQGVLRARDQPLAQRRDAGARLRVGGVARKLLQIELQCIVAAWRDQAVRGECLSRAGQ